MYNPMTPGMTHGSGPGQGMGHSMDQYMRPPQAPPPHSMMGHRGIPPTESESDSLFFHGCCDVKTRHRLKIDFKQP